MTNTGNAEIAQLVEHNLAKVGVASSSLVFRSQNKKAVRNSNGFFVYVCSDVIGNSGVTGHFVPFKTFSTHVAS